VSRERITDDYDMSFTRGEIERARDAVVIDLENPLIKMFAEDYLVTA
jgi:hypothetical protein